MPSTYVPLWSYYRRVFITSSVLYIFSAGRHTLAIVIAIVIQRALNAVGFPSQIEPLGLNKKDKQSYWITIFTKKQMFCSPLQICLSVRYKRQLTFGEHVRKIFLSMSGASASSWLWEARPMDGTIWIFGRRCHVYIAIVRSMLEYSAAAWTP